MPSGGAEARLDGAAGYQSLRYARALSHIGTPLVLPACGGWLLQRPIPGGEACDARGGYPLFTCGEPAGLAEDLRGLGSPLVSLVLVADPLSGLDRPLLEGSGFDWVEPYKDHHVVAFEGGEAGRPAAHHQRNLRFAARRVEVECSESPGLAQAEAFHGLYRQLVERHGITGEADFPAGSLRAQFEVPGLVSFRAWRAGRLAGQALFFLQGPRAYYHLAAYTPEGYACKASFALFHEAIRFFRDRVELLSLGAGAGIRSDGSGGLDRFKAGWSSGTRTAFLCGRIVDRPAYAALSAGCGTGFFPAYRAPR